MPRHRRSHKAHVLIINAQYKYIDLDLDLHTYPGRYDSLTFLEVRVFKRVKVDAKEEKRKGETRTIEPQKNIQNKRKNEHTEQEEKMKRRKINAKG